MALLIVQGDRELEVRTASYGSGIDQPQHAKSVSHIINRCIIVEYKRRAYKSI